MCFFVFFLDSFKISPNPSTDFFTIDSKFEIQNLEIFDVVGKKVKEYNNLNTNSYTVNLDEFTSGLYFVKINNTTTLKLIVK